MASTVQDLRYYVTPKSSPQSTLSVKISCPSYALPTFYYSTPTTAITIRICVRQIQSERPDTALTIGAIRNIFDLSAILDIGVLELENEESGDCITLHSAAYSPSVRSNFKFSWGRDIRESVEFVSVPSKDSGEDLTLEFELSMHKLQELWNHRSLRKTASVEAPFARPGKWRLHFVSEKSVGFHHNGILLWTWGDLDKELKGKKFEYPVETRFEFDLEAEEQMIEERMKGEYVQLHPNDGPEVECFIAVETDKIGPVISFE